MIRLTALLFVTALIPAQAQTTSGYDVVPSRTRPDSAFSLWLLSENFNCASMFSNINVVVSPVSTGGRPTITVSYLTEQNPLIRCTTNPGLVYGPQFPIPALRAGIYDVIANPKQACQVNPPFCMIPDVYLNVGTLRVGAGNGNFYSKPKTVRANAAFDLQLLNEIYGNCNYSFTNTVFISSGTQRRINTASLMNYEPARLCLMDIHPHGPVFTVSGLAAGVYQVFYRERDSCELQNPPCPVISPNVLIDTLTVLAPLPIQSKSDRMLRRRFEIKGLPRGYRADGRKEWMLEKAALR